MNNKLRLVLLFSFLLITVIGKAQFSVWAAYTSTVGMKYSTFDQFRTSYNKVFASTLKKEMPMFRYGNGFSTGMSVHGKVIYAEVTADWMRTKTVGEFTNGEKRELDLRQRLQCDGIGFGGSSETASCFVVGGIAIGQMIMYSSYIYNDGTQSFGLEKLLNGHFSGIYVGTYYGITGGFTLVPGLKAMFRVIRNSALKYDSKRNTLDDIHYGRDLGYTVYPHGLPTDYEAYSNQGLNYPTENYVAIDLKAWKIFFGLQVDLGTFKK